MCRRCGEPDRRPGAARRRILTRRLLEIHGNGVVCPCTWCPRLLGAKPGYMPQLDRNGRRVYVYKLERDRLIPKGSYGLYNLVPSCGPCNRERMYGQRELPEGCYFGPGDEIVTPAV